jgi:hypothetical protein
LRVAPREQPNCSPEPCVITREISGRVDDATPERLGVELDSVTPNDITLDPFEAEFRVLNTGLVPIEVPVSPHLSDLQPPEEWQSFPYLSLALMVSLSAIGPAQASGVGWVELYGSAEHEDTVVTLKPGQWVRVKAKVKLHTWPSQQVEAHLVGNFWLHNNVFKPEASGGFVDAVDVSPNRTMLPNSIGIHFSPARSNAAAP